MFRDASRIAQVLAASDKMPGREVAVSQAMASFDAASALRLCEEELNRLFPCPLGSEARVAYEALMERDLRSIVASEHALSEAAVLRDMSVDGATAALGLAVAAFRALRSQPRRPA